MNLRIYPAYLFEDYISEIQYHTRICMYSRIRNFENILDKDSPDKILLRMQHECVKGNNPQNKRWSGA